MKNPTAFITKDDVSDANLMRAARHLLAETENLLAIVEYEASKGPYGSYGRDIATARAALAKAYGEDKS